MICQSTPNLSDTAPKTSAKNTGASGILTAPSLARAVKSRLASAASAIASESDIQLIESFLERQNQLDNGTAIAERLAGQMLAKMDSAEAEALLANMPIPIRLRRIVAAYRE